VPDLQLNAEYAALARDRRTDRGLRDYLRGKVQRAQDLIGAIAMRQATLLRVATAMMRRQPGFLAHGRSALRPMRMAELATELGMHTSTISRAIAGKHVATDLGLFRLRDCFDGGWTAGEADGPARCAVAERIAGLVQAEDKRAPLSDEAIVAALRAADIDVARRTVAKFRRQLQIPSSYQRRRHGSIS
jgi:RNA polymerase sigma-54 factor